MSEFKTLAEQEYDHWFNKLPDSQTVSQIISKDDAIAMYGLTDEDISAIEKMKERGLEPPKKVIDVISEVQYEMDNVLFRIATKQAKLRSMLIQQLEFAQERLRQNQEAGNNLEAHSWSGYIQALRFIQSEL